MKKMKYESSIIKTHQTKFYHYKKKPIATNFINLQVYTKKHFIYHFE